MIVAPTWIWLHFPKCAGSATEKILRDAYANDPSVKFDPVGPTHPVIWHQTAAQRHTLDPTFDPAGKRIIANIRRLPHWLLSRIHFEVQRSGPAGAVSRKDLLRGNFLQRKTPTEPIPSRLVNADKALTPFLREVTDWMRTEELLPDLSATLGRDFSPTTPREEKVNVGRIEYIRELSFWFTPRDLEKIYEHNPQWADLERRLYGDTLKL